MTYLKSLDTIASLQIPHLDALVTLDGEVTESDDTASPLRPINSPVALTDPNTMRLDFVLKLQQYMYFVWPYRQALALHQSYPRGQVTAQALPSSTSASPAPSTYRGYFPYHNRCYFPYHKSFIIRARYKIMGITRPGNVRQAALMPCDGPLMLAVMSTPYAYCFVCS